MGLQTGAVSLVCLGVGSHPTLQAGTHLRLFVRPDKGFPPYGFDVFRRFHRPGSSPQVLDFSGQPLGDLAQGATVGVTTWSASDPFRPNRFVTASTNQGSRVVLSISRLTTCRFDPSQLSLRRIELDLVHWGPSHSGQQPINFTFWGLWGGERVAEGAITLDHTNYGQVITVAVNADALDGFQTKILGYSAPYGIVRVRWVRVEDEAQLGWGVPLNPRRIGFPLTTPGYLVTHAHSPDLGMGAEDWAEAADRMSPTGQAAGLPGPLQQRFGPPTFNEARELMRRALARDMLTGTPATPADPRTELDAVSTTLIAAIDPDFARLLGLALIDRTAAIGTRYDYKVTGYWPGGFAWQWVCTSVPVGAPSGSTATTIPGPSGTTGTTVTVSRATARATRERVVWQPGLRVVAGPQLTTAPSLDAVPGLAISGLPAETPLVRGGADVFGTVDLRPSGAAPTGASSLRFALEEATDGVRVQASSRGPEPLTVLALAGETVVAAESNPGGVAVEVTLNAPGISTVVITGNQPVVTTLCQLRLVPTFLEESWICFDVVRGPVPALPAPGPLSAKVLPGFATPTRPSEQLAGLDIEPPAPARSRDDPFPFARLPKDAVVYELQRRADGAAPISSATAGTWVDFTVDPTSGRSRPLLRSTYRPPTHQTPSGWPPDPPQFLDDTIDPATRYYSYRARGRDLFGRTSDWSTHISVDCADRVGPPPVAGLVARYLDPQDPWLTTDEAAVASSAAAGAILVRWAWTRARWQQAPDAAQFRLYFDSESFHSLRVRIDSVTALSSGYRVSITILTPGVTPDANDLANDWVRQGIRQFLIRSSTAGNPSTLEVAAEEGTAPEIGDCSINLRVADPQRLDFLGSPLRRDGASPLNWERRLLQGPIRRLSGAVAAISAGASVTLQQVTANAPRAGLATVQLAPGWRWSGELPEPCELEVGGVGYPVRAASLGTTASFVVDLTGRPIPAVGSALVRDNAGALRTLPVAGAVASPAPFRIVGGTAWADGTEVPVLAQRLVGVNTELLVALPTPAPATITQLTWCPDHEAVVTNVTLAVNDQQPIATAVLGVSAVDDRSYAADRRARPGEPTGHGNEGAIASVTVRREYRGAPTVQIAPSGTAGTSELWASIPDGFSGLSRFELRWPATSAHAFVVLHATLDAVLDADQEDRAAGRGAYAGMGALSGTALAQHRAQQSQLGAQPLQRLATAHGRAFAPITPEPLLSSDPLLQDPRQSGWLRYDAPLDGSAPGRHFLRVQAVDEAGNRGPLGPATLPIRVPDGRRPLPPRLRRVIDSDRAVWVVWDAPEASVSTYRVYRSQAPAGATPDVRDMTLLATLASSQTPEPTPVFKGAGQLPGEQPHSLVAIYRAEDYDPTLPPGGQTAAPLVGAFALTGNTVSGLGAIRDGALVFAVVRYAAGGPPTLAASTTGRAYRDATAAVGVRYRYRVECVRQAAIGPFQSVEVRSFPSAVGEGTAFDPRPPAPPTGTVMWQSAQQRVEIGWGTSGLLPGLELVVQRTEETADMWRSVTPWLAAAAGVAHDRTAVSGRTYLYRLRVRSAAGRVSEGEPPIGPLTVP